MKYLLLSLFLIPTLSYSQAKRDTKVIVTVSDTSNLFNRVVMSLYERGYTLEQKDEKLNFIATGEKPMPKLGASMKLRVMIKDSIMVVTGLHALDIKIMGLERTFDPNEYRGMKGSVWMTAWDEMVSFARQFGEVKFAK